MSKRLVDALESLFGEPMKKAKKKPQKELSRQRRWQIRQRLDGKCVRCGRLRQNYAAYCDECRALETARQRAKLGQEPWQPGGVGRPPKVQE